MIRISLNGLTVEGATRADFDFALSQVPIVAKLASEHSPAPRVAPRIATSGPMLLDGFDYVAKHLADFPALRFRVAKCEQERFAIDKATGRQNTPEQVRQLAAKQRLEHGSAEAVESPTPSKVDPNAPSEGVTYDGSTDLEGEVPVDFEA